MPLLIILLLSLALLPGGPTQDPPQGRTMTSSSMPTVAMPAFTVIGPFVRTTNAAEMSNGHTGKIGPLWRRFLGGEAGAIPEATDKTTTYAVYSDYESDETGAYDLTLGKAVAPGQQAPPGMRSLSIPAARYLAFPVADPSPAAIKSAWMLVYKYFAQHPEQHRAFTYDFEEHAGDGTRILIAIR